MDVNQSSSKAAYEAAKVEEPNSDIKRSSGAKCTCLPNSFKCIGVLPASSIVSYMDSNDSDDSDSLDDEPLLVSSIVGSTYRKSMKDAQQNPTQ